MDANEYPRTRGDRWQDHATCAIEKIPLAVFYPPPGDNRGADAAKAICARCPVRHDCLDDEMGTDHPFGLMYGVRGGLTVTERRNLRARRNGGPRRPPTPAKCGEDAGYQKHRRLQEDPCPACLQAHRLESAKWRDSRRGVAS